MGLIQPKYPQKPLLPLITDHEALPSEAIELARISDRPNSNELLMLLKTGPTLVLLDVSIPSASGGNKYRTSQFEAPLGFLSWFAHALNEFRKPPAEGGLHAGAMTSADQDVEGEMLCIQRSMGSISGQPGYVVVNRSRPSRLYARFDEYRASEVTFPENFLYEGGLLKLITELGDKYRKGLL